MMKLYLDLDGVLVDFTTGLMQKLNVPYDYPVSPFPLKPGVWDYFPELKERYGVTFEQCDGVCDRDFWANLIWMFDGHDILRVIADVFDPIDIRLLTSPMPNLDSASGKMEWVDKNLPPMKKKTIITSVDKGEFAAPDRILIDDRDENIDSWCKAGGIGILCPRPWNRASCCADDAPGYITEMLEESNEQDTDYTGLARASR